MRHLVEGHQAPLDLVLDGARDKDRTAGPAEAAAGRDGRRVLGIGLVLVVEDDEGYSYALVRRLHDAGIEVVAVSTGFAALLLLESTNRFDLLVLDIRLGLGQPDGVAIARTVRLTRDVKIIFLTSYDDVAGAESLGPVLLKADGVEGTLEAILVALGPP